MKKSIIMKTVSFVMALFICVPFAACQNQNSGAPGVGTATPQPVTAQPATSSPTETPAPQELAEISIFYSNTSTLANRSDTALLHYIEEQTNTKITIMDAPSGEAGNKLNLLIASQSAPDICQSSGLNTLNNYGQQGAFYELSEILETQMSYTMNAINDDAIMKLKAGDGKIYTVPMILDSGANAFFIRQDWLDNLGMPMPTTMDEYYNVLKAFTENDPDQNNQNDTFGLGFQINSLEAVCGMFGIPSAQWMDTGNGNLIYSDVSDKMKEALAFAIKLYNEGIIDPEFAVMKQEQYEQKLTTGAYGVTITRASAAMRYNLAIQKLLPQGELLFMLPPKADNVERGYSATLPIIEDTDGKTFGGYCSISANTKELDGVIRVLDWFFSPEGQRASVWGVEDVHYQMVNNRPVLLPDFMGAENSANYVAEINSYWLAGIIDTKEGGDDSLWMQVNNPVAVNNMIQSLAGSFHKLVYFNTPTGDSAAGDINKAKLEIFTHIIMNGISLDEGWDQWLKEFDRLGGNKWTQEVNDSFKIINAGN